MNVQVVERCCHGDSGEPGESAFGISDEKNTRCILYFRNKDECLQLVILCSILELMENIDTDKAFMLFTHCQHTVLMSKITSIKNYKCAPQRRTIIS